MLHQDWEPVQLGAKKKKGKARAAAANGGRRQANRSTFGHGVMGTTATGGRKLEEETETFRLKRVALPVSKAIQQGRAAAGLTQKQLAQRLNVKAATVQAYENGKAVPSGKVIQRIEHNLGLGYGAISGKARGGKKGRAKQE